MFNRYKSHILNKNVLFETCKYIFVGIITTLAGDSEGALIFCMDRRPKYQIWMMGATVILFIPPKDMFTMSGLR